MSPGHPNKWFARVRPIIAIALVATAYGAARLPTIPTCERDAMSRRFQWERHELPTLGTVRKENLRPVNPSMRNIEAWLASTGAAVALNDLDGDGLSNDLCYTDPRTNHVVVCPVPGTPDRYAPFVLDPGAALFDGETMTPMSVMPGDFNEDGLMDILVNYWGRTPIVFLRKTSSGVAAPSASAYLPREVAPGGGQWYTSTACLADLDGDTHVDIVIGNYFADDCDLLHADSKKPCYLHSSMSRGFNGGTNRVLRWKSATAGEEPSVTFEELPGVFDDEVAHAWTLAIGAADLDGDLLPELYFANDFGPDRLMHNRSRDGRIAFARLDGIKHLTTPNSKALGRDSFKGMGVDFGDLNGDGRLDMYVSNIADEYALEESHFAWVSTGDVAAMSRGIAPYDDLGESLGLSRGGWGWETKLADFDNDGVLEAIQATGFLKGDYDAWPDLHEVALSNDRFVKYPSDWGNFHPGADLSGHEHNPFYVRAADGRYYDVATQIDLGDDFVTRGIATADVDGDGRVDFAIANQWEPSYCFLNRADSTGAFLGLQIFWTLDDAEASALRVSDGHPSPTIRRRPAVGTFVTAHLPDGRILVNQVDGGNGHAGARSPDVYFGLGSIDPATELTVDIAWHDASGAVHRDAFKLKPGWHTILLNAGDSRRPI